MRKNWGFYTRYARGQAWRLCPKKNGCDVLGNGPEDYEQQLLLYAHEQSEAFQRQYPDRTDDDERRWVCCRLRWCALNYRRDQQRGTRRGQRLTTAMPVQEAVDLEPWMESRATLRALELEDEQWSILYWWAVSSFTREAYDGMDPDCHFKTWKRRLSKARESARLQLF